MPHDQITWPTQLNTASPPPFVISRSCIGYCLSEQWAPFAPMIYDSCPGGVPSWWCYCGRGVVLQRAACDTRDSKRTPSFQTFRVFFNSPERACREAGSLRELCCARGVNVKQCIACFDVLSLRQMFFVDQIPLSHPPHIYLYHQTSCRRRVNIRTLAA